MTVSEMGLETKATDDKSGNIGDETHDEKMRLENEEEPSSIA